MTSLAEAVAKLDEIKGSEPTPRRTRQRFDDFGEQWLMQHAHELAASTRERYAEALTHAAATFGCLYVDAIQPADVRDFVSRQLKKGYATSTVNARHRVLRVVLDDLVADGELALNPARAVKTRPEGHTKGRRGQSLSLDEFRRFLLTVDQLAGSEIAEDIARMLQVVAWTGLRRGELLALRFTDQVEGELRIERSVWRRQEKATKTDDPRRITVVPPLAEVLVAQRRWLLATQHPGLSSGLVFPASPRQAAAGAKRRGADEVSWYRSPSIFVGPMKKVVQAANITDISAHSLRRTWENLLREAGVDQLVRRALAGWRSEKAQAIYATVAKGEREAAGDAVVRLVMGEGS